MKNIKLLSLLLLSVIFVNCSKEDEKRYDGKALLTFEKSTAAVGVIIGTGSSDLEITFGTLVAAPGAAVTIAPAPLAAGDNAVPAVLGVDYTIASSTITLDGGLTHKFVVKFLEGGATQVGKKVLFKISSPTVPNAIFNQTVAVTVKAACAEASKVNLNIRFDSYASEISWNVRNSTNQVIATSGPYADGLATFNLQLCLAPGVYRFTMNDVYGDGLFTSPTNSGTFALTLVNGTVLVSGGGNFGFTTGALPFTMN